ncbi:MAG TPA: D-alanyl-D-alanine carboxypeptidase family protein [Paracoccaceae bacterium]|nr:D-alanyl-D-alanine carboxypeptidase family protein [Paracoccaceae bacterium]HMO71595.1 D-alanyl-D-alanine carboxypeptidase family protein [Paracoccaceae bacterium]
MPPRCPVVALALALVLLLPGLGQAFDTRATAAWVYDMKSGTVLLDKNADEALPPASMSKLMTLNMLFEALRDGRVTMQTTFPVSTRARRMGGSTMFLNEMDNPSVEDLIKGIIINSGNDACVVVAEGLSGSEETFSRQMTERGRALGMTNSVFMNASGWPAAGHVQSMRDLGIIARRLIADFPEYYPYFAMTEFNYKGRSPANARNRNPLLTISGGDWTADGLKTGHTSEAGFGLVGSALRGDRRVIFVVTGLPTDAARSEESAAIVNWAFRQFVEKTVARKGVRVTEAEVWMGATRRVGLVPAEDVTVLLPALVQGALAAEVVYTGPLAAPVAAGQPVAELVIRVPDLPDRRIPLVAEADVPRGGFVTRLGTAAQSLIARATAS